MASYNIILVAKGSEDSLKAYANTVESLLENFDEWISDVSICVPAEFLRKNSLKLLTMDQLSDFGEIYYNPNIIPFLQNLNNTHALNNTIFTFKCYLHCPG